MKHSKICIVGAGPAGSIAALFLAKFGINCILIDKARFPRDKICGDGISGWIGTVLNELDKDLLIRMAEQPFMLHSHGVRIVAPNSKYLDLPFLDDKSIGENVPPGFVAQRIHFDNFLIEEVKKQPEIELIEDTEITNFNYENGSIILSNKNTKIHSKIVIFANGANSAFMKKPGGIIKNKKHTMTGVRAYYSGVTGFHKQNYIELHFIKDLVPGYFWIFPLAEGLANVGVGLDLYRISKRKINLKEIMLNSINNIPYLKERFANARLKSKIEAYGLPLWDKRRKISGDNFMLAGDAASLIDPVTGEGMGHAAVSGMLAAKQAKISLEANNFSAGFLQQYDQSIYDKIGNELSINSKIPRFIKYPWLLNGVINKAVKSKTLQNGLTQAMTDLNVRKRLKQPSLYLKILLGK